MVLHRPFLHGHEKIFRLEIDAAAGTFVRPVGRGNLQFGPVYLSPADMIEPAPGVLIIERIVLVDQDHLQAVNRQSSNVIRE